MGTDSSLKEHLHQLEEILLKPEVRSDPGEMKKLLAEEFFEFGSSGNVWQREDFVGENGESVRQMSLSDFDIHPLAEGVVLTTYRVKDETRKQATLRSSIWKYIDDRWQMVFHQGTITHMK